MTGFAAPVVLAVYNRPSKVQRMVETLERIRPSTLLVVADGPKADRAGDAERVREVRKILDRIPWPCELLRLESPTNVGCDAWVPRGIDWAFEHVERAVILEDDLIVHPGFFPWCESLLQRYEGDGAIACVCGRNPMVTWPAAGADHVLMHRGSNLGFGTWRGAWQSARTVSLPGPNLPIARQREQGRMDPAVADHLDWLRALCSSGVTLGWDTQWELRRAMAGMLSVVSPTNMVVHGGYDEEATHDWQPDALESAQPLLDPPELDGKRASGVDHRLDRWSLLIALANVCRDPRMARRIARSAQLVPDGRTRHHLLPFVPGSDFADALEHLKASGCRSPRIEQMLAAFRDPDCANGVVA